jgi:peptidoglycan/LPS O-acetylase OafA/YrhL
MIQPARSRYVNVLQIVGALGIVAYHVYLLDSRWGWILVELFFVIAGMNMMAALSREGSIASYALARVRRLGAPMLVVWSVAVLMVITDRQTPGMLWFILAGPVFAENLTVGLFRYTQPYDWVFAPVWFVCALLQLQLVLFVLRRMLARVRPMVLVGGCVVAGVAGRLLFAAIFGDDLRTLSTPQANALYCLPFAHLEAIVLGLMIGRGQLQRLGRLAPWLGVGVAVLIAADTFSYPLRLNFAYAWGYALLAFTAAALCSPRGWPAVVLARLAVPRWLDALVSRLASLTYGAYAFHGLVMASGINAAISRRLDPPGERLLLLALTAIQSFAIAWIFDLVVRSLEEYRRPRVSAREQLPLEAPVLETDHALELTAQHDR